MRIRPLSFTLAGALLAMLAGSAAYAQDAAPEVNAGNTAWVLASSALVLLMTPGLALFYGGMVRRKNALATLMQSFICLGLISVQWTLIGYSLAFAPGNAFIGGFQWLGLNGVGQTVSSDYGTSAGIPHMAFMVFQCMFAIITPALISGAFAERMKFSAFVIFVLLWATLVYDPIAHWVWATDGWLLKLGALDFAGGTVVHISSGISALVCALVMGKRRGYPGEDMRPHNLTMTLLGTGLLWFGWFGFNGGSSLAADGIGVNAFVVTNMAAAAAALAWMFIEWKHRGEPTVLGAASGAVAGLVGITPAAGFVGVMPALAIGAIAGAICYLAVVILKPRLGYDDSLDTFGVHCVGGAVGALLTGVFCSTAVNSAGKDGLIFGNAGQMVPQLIGVVATMAYAAVVTFILLKIIDAVVGLRVKEQAEEEGLDLSQHGELAYDL